jgi:hypothetical protein
MLWQVQLAIQHFQLVSSTPATVAILLLLLLLLPATMLMSCDRACRNELSVKPGDEDGPYQDDPG